MTDASREQLEELETLDIPTEVDHRHHSGHLRTHQQRRSPEERAMALAVYAETGSTETASRETGIPSTTIATWIARDSNIDAELEAMRRVLRERLAAKYAKAAELALDGLIDRLENGDYHIDKEGTITRRPMPGRELGFTSSLMTDKHALLTGVMGRQSQAEKLLTSIAARLLEAGRKGITISHPSPTVEGNGD